MKAIPAIRHWHPAPYPPDLLPGGLHLWRVRTGPEGAPLDQLWPLLSPREVDRARRFRFDRHRERFIRAGAGLRRILSGYLEVAPQAIPFEYAAAGKPRLTGGFEGLDFNLTTSGDLALVALSANQPVGVDCERIRDCGDAVAIARRMFTSRQAADIAAAAAEDRLEQFYIAWTALEAEVKADGRGLLGPRNPAARKTLQIRHCVPEPGFIAAVARKRLPPVEEWVTLDPTGR
ncbi:MAG: 4'-phosphopantetheinyl transferase superfamily protein [Chromatiaceae bacterium]|nr:4'-phosphopantetheinyl transferase superfamily protein [Chromatiaceae bacterium]